MIIAFRSRFDAKVAFAIGKWTIASIAFALIVYFSISFFRSKPVQVSSVGQQVARNLNFDEVLSGPLALRENKRSPLALALEQKLILLMQSIRPDLGKGEQLFQVGIKGSEQQAVVKEGEPILFNLKQHESGGIEEFEFSESGAKQMVPYVLNGNSLLLKLDGDDELILQATTLASPSTENLMGKVKWWGKDLFFLEYGGAQYRPLGEKHKIEFKDGVKSYFLFVEPKDYLGFKDNRWRVLSSLEEADREAPLAVVQSISSNQLEIQGWDPLFTATIALEKGQPFRASADQVIMDPKMRSSNQALCKIGKKRLILKPNDWVLKSQTGWRKLVTMSEIDSYLNSELLEELFVVDSIESGGLIRGRHFDPLRVQMRPFTIQASKGKILKKRNLSTKR